MQYKYRCENNHEFTADQKISENALTECIICGKACKKVPFTGDAANGAFAINGYKAKNGYS